MLGLAEERRHHNMVSSNRSFNNVATQLNEKHQIWLSRSIYLNNCPNSTVVVSTNDVNELWRPNKSSRLRMECKPSPFPEVNYSLQAKQQRAFDRNCRRASASAVMRANNVTRNPSKPSPMSTKSSASSIRNGLHGYLTGSRYNSAHHIDSHALNNLGVYIPRGYAAKPFEVAFGSRTHSGFNSSNVPFPVPPTSPVMSIAGAPGDDQMQSSVFPAITEAIVHVGDIFQVANPLVDSASARQETLPRQFESRHPSTTKMSPPSFQCNTTSQVLNTEMPDSNDHTSLVVNTRDRGGLHCCIIYPEVQQNATQTPKLHADTCISDANLEYHKTQNTDVNNSDVTKDVCRRSTVSLNSSRSATIVVNLTNLQTADKEQDEDTDVETQGSQICTPNRPKAESTFGQ